MKQNKTGICDSCKHKTKELRMHEGNFYCWGCYRKLIILMPTIPGYVELKDALNKVREVKCGGSIKNPLGLIHVPRVLIGRKVKLVLVEK